MWENGTQRESLAQTAVLGKRWGQDCCLPQALLCSANTPFCLWFGFTAAHCHCWWESTRELFMQDTIKCFHFKLIVKVPLQAVWTHRSHTQPCVLPEHSMWTLPWLLQGHSVLSFSPSPSLCTEGSCRSCSMAMHWLLPLPPELPPLPAASFSASHWEEQELFLPVAQWARALTAPCFLTPSVSVTLQGMRLLLFRCL